MTGSIFPPEGERVRGGSKVTSTVSSPVMTGAPPQISAGPAAGQAPTVALLSGVDFAGVIQIIPGAGADDTNDLVTVTFANPLAAGSIPQVVLVADNSVAALLDFLATGESATGFGIAASGTGAVGLAGLLIQIRYLIFGTRTA